MTLGQNGMWDTAILLILENKMANLNLIDFKIGSYIQVDVNNGPNKYDYEVHISSVLKVNHYTLEFWDFCERPPVVEIILDWRIFERWFRITPHDVGLKSFPEKLWAKNCFGHVISRDMAI